MVTSTFLSSNSKHDFCYTMANISRIQQCLHLTMHFLLWHLAAKMLSPLSHNFILFPYFFTYYETCSINVNSLFHVAIKNLHIKANSIIVFFILLYFTTTLSEGITHTCKNISSLKMVTNIPIAKSLKMMGAYYTQEQNINLHLNMVIHITWYQNDIYNTYIYIYIYIYEGSRKT